MPDHTRPQTQSRQPVCRAGRPLAGQLRELRESAGITQERLAAQAGVSIATVRKIETGAVIEPGYFTVMALMALLAFPQ